MLCVVGDGEAETGPLAASWHSNKFLNPVTDGAVLPLCHRNCHNIASPTVLAPHHHNPPAPPTRGVGAQPTFGPAPASPTTPPAASSLRPRGLDMGPPGRSPAHRGVLAWQVGRVLHQFELVQSDPLGRRLNVSPANPVYNCLSACQRGFLSCDQRILFHSTFLLVRMLGRPSLGQPADLHFTTNQWVRFMLNRI